MMMMIMLVSVCCVLALSKTGAVEQSRDSKKLNFYTMFPTEKPTETPTRIPTPEPTEVPTAEPTTATPTSAVPTTAMPTADPTTTPTYGPGEPTPEPTEEPTLVSIDPRCPCPCASCGMKTTIVTTTVITNEPEENCNMTDTEDGVYVVV